MVLISIPTVVSDSTGASTVFATCPETQSTIILEFQGVIEMDGSTFAGNKLGLLSILDGVRKSITRTREHSPYSEDLDLMPDPFLLWIYVIRVSRHSW